MKRAGAGTMRGSKDMPFFLRVGKKIVMRGDETSIAVIFNNIEGRNFEPDRLQALTRSEYLNYMGGEVGVPLVPGTPIAWGPFGGVLREQGQVRSVATKDELLP